MCKIHLRIRLISGDPVPHIYTYIYYTLQTCISMEILDIDVFTHAGVFASCVFIFTLSVLIQPPSKHTHTQMF